MLIIIDTLQHADSFLFIFSFYIRLNCTIYKCIHHLHILVTLLIQHDFTSTYVRVRVCSCLCVCVFVHTYAHLWIQNKGVIWTLLGQMLLGQEDGDENGSVWEDIGYAVLGGTSACLSGCEYLLVSSFYLIQNINSK